MLHRVTMYRALNYTKYIKGLLGSGHYDTLTEHQVVGTMIH